MRKNCNRLHKQVKISLQVFLIGLALLFLSLPLTAIAANPTQYTLKGQVIDISNKLGIPQVKVSIADKTGKPLGSVTTDSQGSYQFPGTFSERPNTFKITLLPADRRYNPKPIGGSFSANAKGDYIINLNLYSSYDTTPPEGKITINNNSPYTNSTAVTLYFSASDSHPRATGVRRMRLANAGSNWGSSRGFSTRLNWTLPAGNGAKTVNVQFQDASGNWSAVYSDEIVLDSSAPELNIISPLDNAVIRPG